MAIITISRGTFAGGAELATILARELGYRTVSRESLYRRADEAFGVTEGDLVQIMTWAPGRQDPGGNQRRRLFLSIQAALCLLLKDDDVVYHGLAGHLLLPQISHVVRVRLIAPRARRIRMAMAREGTTSEQASAKIDEVDSQRARWTEFVFGANWADPALYDLVLNLEHMELESAARVVCSAVQQPDFRATDASRSMMHELTVQSVVLARLLGDRTTSDLELRVQVDHRRVTLHGPVDSARRDRVLAIVGQVPGITKVVLDHDSTSPEE